MKRELSPFFLRFRFFFTVFLYWRTVPGTVRRRIVLLGYLCEYFDNYNIS